MIRRGIRRSRYHACSITGQNAKYVISLIMRHSAAGHYDTGLKCCGKLCYWILILDIRPHDLITFIFSEFLNTTARWRGWIANHIVEIFTASCHWYRLRDGRAKAAKIAAHFSPADGDEWEPALMGTGRCRQMSTGFFTDYLLAAHGRAREGIILRCLSQFK